MRAKNDLAGQTIPSDVSAEKRAKRFWVSLVLVLMGIQVVIGGVALTLAIGNPSMAVVPDYHRTALNWDETRRALLASEDLGWNVSVSASDEVDGAGMRALVISITNSDSQSVVGLRVTGTAFHHAHADEVLPIQVGSPKGYQYFAMVPMREPGLWQVDLSIEGANTPVAESFEIEVRNL